MVARLATTHEKLVAGGPNPVILATPQVTMSSFVLSRDASRFSNYGVLWTPS